MAGRPMPDGSATTAAIRKVGLAVAVGMALHAIYVAYFGGWEPSIHRAAALFACIVIVTLTAPLATLQPNHPRLLRGLYWLIDLGILAVSGYACWRFVGAIDDIENLVASFSLWDQLSALLAILALLELTRRSFGLVLAAVGAVSLAYCLFGADLPWVFRHSGFTLEQSMEIIWYGFQGVFGLPTGIVLSLIFIFIVFGALLEGTGAGEALIRIAFAATGRTRGGPAHAAIVASGLFGTTSGSVTANVVGTGVVTIPLIKRRGFHGAFAGAVEAAASSGGQIMPPVMGAAAFLMTDLTGIPYLTICAAALIPALFYYGSLFVAVGLEARRLGIEPIPPSERQRLSRDDIVKSMMVFGPVALILLTLALGRSPAMAGFWATVSTVAIALVLNPELRQRPQRLLEALARGGVAGAKIMMAVGAIGIMLAVLNLTGIGLKFATEIAHLGTTSLFTALVLAALSCLVLGMGMPTLPAYLIIVLVLGPAIKLLGLPTLAVHLFVFYFGVLSALTPPVALAAIAAAPIADANPMRTAVVAVALAFVGFIIPFVFVYEPSLLLVLDFDPTAFAWVALRLVLAVWLLSTAFVGFEAAELRWWSRLARVVAGFGLILTVPELQIAGLVLAVLLLVADRFAARRQAAAATEH